MSEFPLLDGSVVRMDRELDSHPDVDATDAVVLRADFAREQLPWWLSYSTDSGPASPTFNGLASGDTTDVVLNTGAASGSATVLAGPTVNWDNWSEIRFYVFGARIDTAGDAHCYSMLSDTRADDTVSDAFWTVRTQNDQFVRRVYNSGTEEMQSSSPLSGTSRAVTGFRLVENDAAGHSLFWNKDGQVNDGWGETQGFPTATDLTFHVGIRSRDGADHQTTIDGIYIELIP